MSIQTIGLYIKDATTNPDVEGAATITNERWKRSNLKYNNKSIGTTSLELNNYGLYVTDNKLKLNGETLSEIDNSLGLTINSDVNFGKVLMSSNKKCIKITLNDYNNLRQGNKVSGYANYNPNAVYYITDDVSGGDVTYTNIVDKEDVIYNSYTGELLENSLSNKTFTDPKNTPELAVRGFNAITNSGKGITLEYFVDTRHYDSINNGIIGNTFTTIITDLYNNVIFKRTTYAGQFKITTAAFKDLNGNNLSAGTHTWFRIRCIDNEGRGSVDYFYNIFIDKSESTKRIFNISDKAILNLFGLTTFLEDTYESATFELGYKTKKGFYELCNWVKSLGYDGIKLYNEQGSTGKNTVYVFDSRANLGQNEEFIPAYNDYYLFYFDGDKLYAVNQSGKIDISSEFYRGKTKLLTYTYNDFLNSLTSLNALSCKIDTGSTFNIDGVSRKVQGDPYEWIKKDGAYIYRDTDSGKIRTLWRDVSPNEIHIDSNLPYLCTRNLQLLFYHMGKAISTDSTNAVNKMFPRGAGYYYVYWYHGSGTIEYKYVYGQEGEYNGILPNHFTIDLNGATIIQPNDDMVHGFNFVFFLDGNVNVHIRNGNIIGSYTRDKIKDAFLKQGHSAAGVWEGGDIISVGGSRYCSLENINLSNTTGYGIFIGSSYGRVRYNDASSTRKQTNFKTSNFGYINTSKTFTTTNYIIKEDGKSIVPETLLNVLTYLERIGKTYDENPNYIFIKPEDNSDVCLLTSDEFVDLDAMLFKHAVHAKRGDKATPRTYDYDNKLQIDNNYCNYIIYDSFADRYPLGGVYPEIFINFYDKNGNFINTIKTTRGLTFKKILSNSGNPATKSTMTVYGIGKTENNVFLLYKADYGSWNSKNNVWVSNEDTAFLHWQYYRVSNVAEDFTIKNCNISNTRSIVTGNPGVNCKIINTTFSKVCSTDKAFTLTPMLLDWEESAVAYNTLTFDNCKVLKELQEDGYNMDLSVLGLGFNRNVTIKNCDNIGLTGPCTGGYFADTKFTKCALMYNGGLYTNYNNIMKRCTLGATSGALLIYNETTAGPAYTYILEGKHCWDPTTNTIGLNDCFIVTRSLPHQGTDSLANSKHLIVKGRVNKVMGSLEGNYAEVMITDIFNKLISKQENAINSQETQTDNWVHCLVKTTERKQPLCVGYYAGGYIKEEYTYNGIKKWAYPCYIDGERYLTFNDKSYDKELVYILSNDTNIAPKNTSNFIIPEKYEPGYHIISFLLNSNQIPKTHSVRIPTLTEYLVVPKKAGNSTTVNKFSLSPLIIYSNCILQCENKFNVNFSNCYPKTIKVSDLSENIFIDDWEQYINKAESTI